MDLTLSRLYQKYMAGAEATAAEPRSWPEDPAMNSFTI